MSYNHRLSHPVAALLHAARATHIPAAAAGLWYVNQYRLALPLVLTHPSAGGPCHRPAGTYTQLFRWTDETLHRGHGELIMQDTPEELLTHLPFMLEARGRVLITGLGLGCVARGCASKPSVSEVTIVERDQDVLDLVRPAMFREPHAAKYQFVHADARDFAAQTAGEWDYAWHDLWTDEPREPHLQLWHSELISSLVRKVRCAQGAWKFPKCQKRAWRQLFARSGKSFLG